MAEGGLGAVLAAMRFHRMDAAVQQHTVAVLQNLAGGHGAILLAHFSFYYDDSFLLLAGRARPISCGWQWKTRPKWATKAPWA